MDEQMALSGHWYLGGVPVGFRGMYRGFTPSDSLFVQVAQSVGFPLERRRGASPHQTLQIWGPYAAARSRAEGMVRSGLLRLSLPGGRDRRLASSRRTGLEGISACVFETAENVRVPQGPWSLSLSFDEDAYGGSNWYLPYWVFATDAFGAANERFGAPIRLATLASDRPGTPPGKSFCAAVFRNPDPVRLRLIEALQKVGKVDLFGPAPQMRLRHKSELAGRYRFIVALENDLYPGYVTEKLPEAWSCSAIPIWSGILGLNHPFNESAFLNLAKLGEIDALVDEVAALERDRSSLEHMATNRLLRWVPDFSPVQARVSALLSGL